MKNGHVKLTEANPVVYPRTQTSSALIRKIFLKFQASVGFEIKICLAIVLNGQNS